MIYIIFISTGLIRYFEWQCQMVIDVYRILSISWMVIMVIEFALNQTKPDTEHIYIYAWEEDMY